MNRILFNIGRISDSQSRKSFLILEIQIATPKIMKMNMIIKTFSLLLLATVSTVVAAPILLVPEKVPGVVADRQISRSPTGCIRMAGWACALPPASQTGWSRWIWINYSKASATARAGKTGLVNMRVNGCMRPLWNGQQRRSDLAHEIGLCGDTTGQMPDL